MKIIVFDVGGTFIKSGIYDTKEKTLEHFSSTSNDGSQGTEDLRFALHGGYHSLVKKLPEGSLPTIGICARGQIDVRKGEVISDYPPVIEEYDGFNFKNFFSWAPAPVYVENDVNAAGYAEYKSYLDALREEDKEVDAKAPFCCLTFGTGLGAALILNGEIYHGAHWSAGEAGMMYTDRGNTYEDLASTASLIKRVMEIAPSLDTGEKIAAYYRDKDTDINYPELKENRPEILSAITLWAFDAGKCAASFIHLLDPAVLVLGGGIMEDPSIFNLVKDKINLHLAQGFDVKIIPACHGNKAGLIGAGMLAEKAIMG